MAAGDGKAGAVPTFSFTASEAGTNGTIPELETESANGATTGEELPAMVERVCGDLENIKIDRLLITVLQSSHDSIMMSGDQFDHMVIVSRHHSDGSPDDLPH